MTAIERATTWAPAPTPHRDPLSSALRDGTAQRWRRQAPVERIRSRVGASAAMATTAMLLIALAAIWALQLAAGALAESWLPPLAGLSIVLATRVLMTRIAE